MLVLSPQSNLSFHEYLAAEPHLRKEHLVLWIGPEGDFSPRELAEFTQRGFPKLQLGSTVLRVGTAGLAALAKLL